MGGLAITQLVLGAAYQVYLTRTAGPDQIMVSKDEPGKVICLTNFKARALIILPYIKEMEAVPPTVKRNKGTPLISVIFGESNTEFEIEPVAKSNEQKLWPGGRELEDDVAFCNVFWMAYHSNQGASSGLRIAHADISTPGAFAEIKDPYLRNSGKNRDAGTFTVRLPYMTNKDELRRGDDLWCHSLT